MQSKANYHNHWFLRYKCFSIWWLLISWSLSGFLWCQGVPSIVGKVFLRAVQCNLDGWNRPIIYGDTSKWSLWHRDSWAGAVLLLLSAGAGTGAGTGVGAPLGHHCCDMAWYTTFDQGLGSDNEPRGGRESLALAPMCASSHWGTSCHQFQLGSFLEMSQMAQTPSKICTICTQAKKKRYPEL